MSNIVCSTCGIVFGIPDAYERARREDHEGFRCPNGHQQHFPGKTEEEKQIERLKEERRDYIRRINEGWEEIRDLKRRLKVCPLCGWSVPRLSNQERIRQAMKLHLLSVHRANLEEQPALLPGQQKALGPGG